MSETELLLLGLLKESPKHPYRIKKKIEELSNTFLGLRIESIYYPLKKMEEKGLISKKIIRKGKRPERYIYSITKEGEIRFLELLNRSFLSIQRPYFNIDLSLYFLPYVDKDIAKRKLKARVALLNRIKRGLEKAKLDFKKELTHFAIILEHNLELVKSEIKFITHLISFL
jgi:DNA-binding PadR family transcriptional regulator